jgi:hypothetical protein
MFSYVFHDLFESVRDTLVRCADALFVTTEVFAVQVFAHLRRVFSLVVVGIAAEALLFCLWFTLLLPVWRRIGPKISLWAHLGTTSLCLWRLFVARELVLRLCFGDLGRPSIFRALSGVSLVAWSAAQKPMAIPIGAFGAALVGNYGIAWVACFLLCACYTLYARIPSPQVHTPTKKRKNENGTNTEAKSALQHAEDDDEIVTEIRVGLLNPSPGGTILRRRLKAPIPKGDTYENARREFVDSFAEEEPGVVKIVKE